MGTIPMFTRHDARRICIPSWSSLTTPHGHLAERPGTQRQRWPRFETHAQTNKKTIAEKTRFSSFSPEAWTLQSCDLRPEADILCERDRELVCNHFARLSERDLWLRFGSSVPGSWLEQYVDDFFARPGVSVGQQCDGVCTGLGELRPWRETPAEACEIALSVHIGFRCKGIGTTILAKLLALAWFSGFRRAKLLVQRENEAMRCICAKFGASANPYEGQILYEISTRPSTFRPKPEEVTSA